MRKLFFFLNWMLVSALPLAAEVGLSGPAWQPYGDEAFRAAKAEHRLVLLELEAVWCHWCHVMDEKTWSDAQVQDTVRQGFVAIRVDHDARPDLAERYRDYGWPAIIILDADGHELVKRAGYQPKARMLAILDAVRKAPQAEAASGADQTKWTAEVSAEQTGLLSPALAQELQRRFVDSHDFQQGGLRGDLKLVDRDATEYALLLAGRGDANALAMARRDMAALRQLSDPVWGGIYQYSTGGDWAHPHYEKLAAVQADVLRIAALAYASSKDGADLKLIHDVHAYMRAFLRSPEGGFYTSQDADLTPGVHASGYFNLDDAARRRLGLPKVDRHLYARENGLLAQALVQAYVVTGDEIFLHDAKAAVALMLTTRRLPEAGGFRHGDADVGGPFLADNLAMLRALVALYGADGDRKWLDEARLTARFIDRHFRNQDQAGYISAEKHGPIAPVTTLDENLALARCANLLFRYTGDSRDQAMAKQAMQYLARPAVALARVSDPGILLAAEELALEPTHLTIVGAKDDAQAAALFRTALRWPASYKRVEWWDRREGALPNADVNYPNLARPAAYVCSEGRCSRPLFAGEEIHALLQQMKQVQ